MLIRFQVPWVAIAKSIKSGLSFGYRLISWQYPTIKLMQKRMLLRLGENHADK
jgi:hypothetical protein